MSAAALLDAPPQDAAGFAAATGAAPAQLADLEQFRTLLMDWNARVNLVSAASVGEFWPRHAFDSAQLLPLAPSARSWVDLGAGAGFPGLVVAILLKDVPDAVVHLVESQAKRCRFLTEVVATLALPAEVHNARGEDVVLKADVVTARAVAPLGKLLGFARPSLAQGGVGLFLKGRSWEAELAEARALWRFRCEPLPSRSDPESRILKVEGLARAR
jgi:16S rRNA (guanine527-N7)-methyltransferase